MSIKISQVLTNRSSRSAISIVAMLLVLGFLVFADDFPGKVLGALAALFVMGLLKAASELAVTSRRLSESARVSLQSSGVMKEELTQLRLMLSATEESLTRENERVEASIRALHDQVNSVSAGLIGALEGIKNAEHRGEQSVEDLRADINARLIAVNARLIAHSEALMEVIEAQKPVRRHMLHEAIQTRELGLGESLDALVRGRLEPESHESQVPGSNEPEAGGSMSTNG